MPSRKSLSYKTILTVSVLSLALAACGKEAINKAVQAVPAVPAARRGRSRW